MAIGAIKTYRGALDTLKNNEQLRVDSKTGELRSIGKAEKFSLAFQRSVLKKTPEQLGTGDYAVAGALVNLYVKQNPGAKSAQVGEFLGKFGFAEFAAQLQQEPKLSSRQSKIEAAPHFPKTQPKAAQNAEETAPVSPQRKESLRPKSIAKGRALEEAAPVPPERKESLRPESIPKGQVAARRSAAVSHGQQVVAAKQSASSEKASAGSKDSKTLAFIKDLKSTALDENGQSKIHKGNFQALIKPFIESRLGSDLTGQIYSVKSEFYSKLGEGVARFGDIGAPKETLVPLAGGQVHANFVALGRTGDPSIATQAPKTAGQLSSFIQLLEDQNVTTIIDLTNQSDRKRNGTPDYSRSGAHGFSSTDSTSPELRQASIEKRDLKTANNHSVAYLNYTNWQDHGAADIKGFKDLLFAIEKEHGTKAGGLTIHCNAGVGRTGTVFAGLELNRLADEGKLTSENYLDKVLDIVAEGRKARGAVFVQVPEQLNLLIDYAKSLVN
jgi:hypothetical protein